MDGHGHELHGALNDNAGHAGFDQTCAEVLANFVVLDNLVDVTLSAVPIGVPSLDETEAIAGGVCLLSHYFLRLSTIIVT